MKKIKLNQMFLAVSFVFLISSCLWACPAASQCDPDSLLLTEGRGETGVRSLLRRESETAEISGRIIDQAGNPAADVTIELYRNAPDIKFSYFGYFKLSKSDGAGYYSFRNLPPGNYIIGINLGHSPNFKVPYPRTFYPGSSSLKDAQIVGVNDSQKLSITPFVVPLKLKAVKITGRLFWKDGSPVQNLDPVPEKRNCRIHLLDPVESSGFDTIASSGFYSSYFKDRINYETASPTIKVDSDGKFSIWAFEGYPYIVSAVAFDSNKVSWHSNVLITAHENTQPLALKLASKGSWIDKKVLKEELGATLKSLPENH